LDPFRDNIKLNQVVRMKSTGQFARIVSICLPPGLYYEVDLLWTNRNGVRSWRYRRYQYLSTSVIKANSPRFNRTR